LRVEFSRSIREIDAADWNSAVRAAGAPVFYEHAYLAAHEQHPLITGIASFAYFVVRQGDQAVAVAPACLQTAADPLRRLHEVYPEARGQAALLSPVWHCYDAHVPSTIGVDAVPVLLNAMIRTASAFRVRWCGLVHVERGTALSQELRANGLPARHLSDRWTADLTGLTYEHYLARLGQRARANLRRNERRSLEAGVTIDVLRPGNAALTEIALLCDKTANRFSDNGFHPEATFTGFVRALGDHAHVIEVRQRGKLVAAGICLTDATRLHTWACGIDYAVDGNYSPYGVLFAESVRLAIRLGKQTLEGGLDNAAVKLRHGLRPRPLDAALIRT
jgi:hypothetical protein